MALNQDCILYMMEHLDAASLRKAGQVCRTWKAAGGVARQFRTYGFWRGLRKRVRRITDYNLSKPWVIHKAGSAVSIALAPFTPRGSHQDRDCVVFEIPKLGDFLTDFCMSGSKITKVCLKVNGLDYHKTFHLRRDKVRICLTDWLPLRMLCWCRISITVTCEVVHKAEATIFDGEPHNTDPGSSCVIDKMVWLGRDFLGSRVLVSGGFMTIM